MVKVVLVLGLGLGLGVALELEGLSGVSCEREALWVRVWRSRCC